MQAQQHNSFSSIPTQWKKVDYKVPEHIFSDDDGDNIGHFHIASNKAMKPKLFNGFHRTRICQFAFNSSQDGGKGKCKKAPR